MEKKLKQTHRHEGVSKFFKSVVLTGTTLLLLLQPGYSKNNDKVKAAIKETLEHYDAKAYQIQEDIPNSQTYYFNQGQEMMDGGNNAFDFAINNIDKYYPDMRKHLEDMLNSFRDQEHKDSTIALLNEMVKNISDPEQKTGAIIGALEYSVFYKSIFGDKYGNKVTDETFTYIEIFDRDYKTRFNRYYTKLVTRTERLKKEIIRKQEDLKNKQEDLKKGLQELEATMNTFSPNDVKNNASIKKLTTETKKRYTENNFPISIHMQSLFDAVK